MANIVVLGAGLGGVVFDEAVAGEAASSQDRKEQGDHQATVMSLSR